MTLLSWTALGKQLPHWGSVEYADSFAADACEHKCSVLPAQLEDNICSEDEHNALGLTPITCTLWHILNPLWRLFDQQFWCHSRDEGATQLGCNNDHQFWCHSRDEGATQL